MSRKYISIKSVLYDISISVEETMWEPNKAIEWVTNGLGRIETSKKFNDCLALLRIQEHKSELPEDVKYINQAVWRETVDNNDLASLKDVINLTASTRLSGSALAEKSAKLNKGGWTVMTQTSSNFLASFEWGVNYTSETGGCNASAEYYVHPDGCIDTSVKTGYILLGYKGLPRNSEGDILIPDNAHLKDALLHYYLYRYWMTRAFLGDTNAANERDFNLQRFSLLSRKAAGSLNQPDIAESENIRRQVTSLVPTHNVFNSLFSTLSQSEKIAF